jgi:hypothetical protein
MQFFQWIIDNWQGLMGAVSALLVAAIAIAVLIPGDEPEKTLQKVVDFIAKLSNKTSDAQEVKKEDQK